MIADDNLEMPGSGLVQIIERCDWRFPSSKTCSRCDTINKDLKLKERSWTCACGAHHDRDLNASINLERLATAPDSRNIALPKALRKVTPVRTCASRKHEHKPVRNSGQEASLREVR